MVLEENFLLYEAFRISGKEFIMEAGSFCFLINSLNSSHHIGKLSPQLRLDFETDYQIIVQINVHSSMSRKAAYTI